MITGRGPVGPIASRGQGTRMKQSIWVFGQLPTVCVVIVHIDCPDYTVTVRFKLCTLFSQV